MPEGAPKPKRGLGTALGALVVEPKANGEAAAGLLASVAGFEGAELLDGPKRDGAVDPVVFVGVPNNEPLGFDVLASGDFAGPPNKGADGPDEDVFSACFAPKVKGDEVEFVTGAAFEAAVVGSELCFEGTELDEDG